ncbi:MAG: DUF3089 domain-containing protein [Candidatus Nanopelagicales bacterium]
MRLLPVLLPIASATAILAAPTAAHADTVWLCRPGAAANPCEGSLKTTVRTFGKPAKKVTPARVQDPAIDCFYVYPTVSEQQGPVANLAIEPAETSIAQYQAARFSQVCKVYAPMYRQLTLAALLGGGATQQDRDNAYSDVETAFDAYLAENPDRPFVLIGHSQGSGMLKRLIKERIDGDAALRSRMLSAMLTGSTVAVPTGKTVGGDFSSVPICTRKGQINCVISYGSFATKPPASSFFGKVRSTDLPAGQTYEAACTNPASLAKNKRTEVTSYMRGTPIPGTLGFVAQQVLGGKPPTAKTPWLRPKDRYTAKCVTANGAHVLMVKPIGQSRKLKWGPSSAWGLHLLDMNLPLGQLVDIVRAQGVTYTNR